MNAAVRLSARTVAATRRVRRIRVIFPATAAILSCKALGRAATVAMIRVLNKEVAQAGIHLDSIGQEDRPASILIRRVTLARHAAVRRCDGAKTNGRPP